MYSINLWLVALACLERHLSIFVQTVISLNAKRRFLLYHASVIVIIAFVLGWYLYLLALYPCEQTEFDFTQVLCGFPCC